MCLKNRDEDRDPNETILNDSPFKPFFQIAILGLAASATLCVLSMCGVEGGKPPVSASPTCQCVCE